MNIVFVAILALVFFCLPVLAQNIPRNTVGNDDENNVIKFEDANCIASFAVAWVNSGDDVHIYKQQNNVVQIVRGDELKGLADRGCRVSEKDFVNEDKHVYRSQVVDMTLSKFEDLPVYLRSKEGCFVLDPKPIKGESISWTGQCINQYAEGKGVLRYDFPGGWDESLTILKFGKDSNEFIYKKTSDGTELYCCDEDNGGHGKLGAALSDGLIVTKNITLKRYKGSDGQYLHKIAFVGEYNETMVSINKYRSSFECLTNRLPNPGLCKCEVELSFNVENLSDSYVMIVLKQDSVKIKSNRDHYSVKDADECKILASDADICKIGKVENNFVVLKPHERRVFVIRVGGDVVFKRQGRSCAPWPSIDFYGVFHAVKDGHLSYPIVFEATF